MSMATGSEAMAVPITMAATESVASPCRGRACTEDRGERHGQDNGGQHQGLARRQDQDVRGMTASLHAPIGQLGRGLSKALWRIANEQHAILVHAQLLICERLPRAVGKLLGRNQREAAATIR